MASATPPIPQWSEPLPPLGHLLPTLPASTRAGLAESLAEYQRRATGNDAPDWGWRREDLAALVERRRRILEAHRDPVAMGRTLAYFSCPDIDLGDRLTRFIRDWWWTYDPRNVAKGLPPVIPFTPFAKQVEFLHFVAGCYVRQLNWLTEKSRATGISVLVCGAMAFLWRFQPGFGGGLGSRKEELVDRLGDPNCLFEKIRLGLYTLPAWILPPGFDRKLHDNHRRLINPDNGATIIGEAGEDIGRGGRSSLYVLDEHASIERADRVEAALSQTSDCIGYVSTPKGNANLFFRHRFSGQTPVFSIRWQDDPRKTPAWRRAQDAKFDSYINEQELELSYTALQGGSVIPPDWIAAAVEIELRPGTVCRLGLDVSDTGDDLNAAVLRRGGVVASDQTWTGLNMTDTAHRAGAIAEEAGASHLLYDSVGVGAGVRGAAASTEKRYKFRWIPVNSGEAPTTRMLSDDSEHPASERFANLKAEMWWSLRLRFRRTWERHTGARMWPDDECISLPRGSTELAAQLAQPRFDYSETGKVRIESKRSLAARGVKSPDRADACVLAFAEPAELSTVTSYLNLFR
jgi:phage terminase large subunit